MRSERGQEREKRSAKSLDREFQSKARRRNKNRFHRFSLSEGRVGITRKGIFLLKEERAEGRAFFSM
jgi:hypothetical protein